MVQKNTLIQKLTSRKFLLSALAALAGVCALIFGENATVQTVMGALMVILPAVVYCITEGKIDAANVARIADAVTDAAQKLGANDNTVQSLEKIGVAATQMAECSEKNEK
ncbi:MAG: hypothetical protein E7606_06080 [Ruminococcaceae bacterium]|nr:hypothetical protein [Oscillospiraceae bacterium]